MKSPIDILYYFIQFSWGVIQNIIGLLLFLILYIINPKRRIKMYKQNIVTFWNNEYGLSLGIFIFVGSDNKKLLMHEYGHSIQSLIFGPLYLIVVGIPSLLWALLFSKYRKNKNISYGKFYTEKWANKLGGNIV